MEREEETILSPGENNEIDHFMEFEHLRVVFRGLPIPSAASAEGCPSLMGGYMSTPIGNLLHKERFRILTEEILR